MLQRDIESTDQAIDALVHRLYGLTEAEIKIVEAGLERAGTGRIRQAFHPPQRV